MEDTVLKLVFASIILMVGLAGILLPLYITDVSPRLLNLLNAATGGVLLAAGFVHLLPDANAVLMPRFPAFPWAPFLAATGFLSILFVEELANISIGAPSSAPDFRGGDGSHAVGGWRSVSQGDEAPAEPLQEPLTIDLHRFPSPPAEDDSGGMVRFVHGDGDGGKQGAQGTQGGLAELAEEGVEEGGVGHGHHPAGGMTGMILLVALSFHSFMEGLGLGTNEAPAHPTQPSTPQHAADLSQDPYGPFMAVFSHKALAAYALGSRLLLDRSISRHAFGLSAALFASMTPAGMLVGMAVTATAEGEEVDPPSGPANRLIRFHPALQLQDSAVAGVCTALAAGSFLYVAIVEVLVRELGNQMDRVGKLGFLALGFFAMSGLAVTFLILVVEIIDYCHISQIYRSDYYDISYEYY